MELEDDQTCFVCGSDNPIGLKLDFWDDGEKYHTCFTPDGRHSGYTGILHGGILTAVLDEVMGRLLWMRNLRAATAQMEIRWSRAARIGETLHFVGWIEEVRGRLVRCAAEARNEAGQLVARSTAKFMRVSGNYPPEENLPADPPANEGVNATFRDLPSRTKAAVG